jgi:hypothetical protein
MIKELNAKREKLTGYLLDRRRVFYEYDFGDSWEHDVIPGRSCDASERTKVPSLFRRCPTSTARRYRRGKRLRGLPPDY